MDIHNLSLSPSLYRILCMSIPFWQTPVPYGNKLQTPVPYGNKLHTPVPYGNKLHTPVPYGNKLHTPPTNYHLLSCSTRAKQKRLALNEKKKMEIFWNKTQENGPLVYESKLQINILLPNQHRQASKACHLWKNNNKNRHEGWILFLQDQVRKIMQHCK